MRCIGLGVTFCTPCETLETRQALNLSGQHHDYWVMLIGNKPAVNMFLSRNDAAPTLHQWWIFLDTAWLFRGQCRSVGSPLWSILKYHNTYWVFFFFFFFTDIRASRRVNPNDFGDPLTFLLAPPWGWHLWYSVWNVLATTGWIAMKFGTHIHVPLRRNYNTFGDPLTFHLVPTFHFIQCFGCSPNAWKT